MREVFVLFVFVIASIIAQAQFNYKYDNSIPVKQPGDNSSFLKDPWAGGINAGQFSTIDLNADEIEDLVIYDRTSNLLKTYIFKDGYYYFNPDFRSLFPEDIEGWILLEDYNGDGLKDIFTDSQKGMRAFRNIGLTGEIPEFVLEADPVLTEGYSGMINLVVNITDIPSIDDVDGDGDLDILVYNFALGGFIRYHRNMSIENYGDTRSLDYMLETRNWGSFEECDCHLYAFESMGESCTDFASGRKMHPGGKSILLIDMDGDGDMDFLGGHEQCDELYFLENVGTPQQATMTSWREDFPSVEHPATMTTFPAAYYEDINQDGLKDLIVSPNDLENPLRNIDYSSSSRYYRNIGSSTKPEFDYVTNNFLQDQMLDFGEYSVPAFFDFDGNGLMDLMVGRNGFEIDSTFYGSLVLLTNKGSAFDPEFELVNNDYLNLSSLHAFDIIPRFADLNGDDLVDLIVYFEIPFSFESKLRIYWNNSTKSSGFSADKDSFSDIDINLGINGSPFFIDVDKDGLVDMLAGRSTGRLEYYRNEGSESNPQFVLSENEYLGIIDSYVEFRRNLTPCVADLDLDGHEDLITTDLTGSLRIYPDFRNYDPGSEEPTIQVYYNKDFDTMEELRVSYQSFPAVGDIRNNENPLLVLGNPQGGLSVYANTDNSSGDQEPFHLTVFPNPMKDTNQLSFRLNKDGHIVIYNTLGQQIENPIFVPENTSITVEIGYLPAGFYIVKGIDISGQTESRRLVVIN
ncbi:T9SS type A sorting domain-containing protein [Bacteroidota bacterium]